MAEIKPLYQRYAHLYAYDTETKKHMLKSGLLYKKRVATYPNRFVESITMFSDPIPEKPKLAINHVEQKQTTTQIGAPNKQLINSLTEDQINEQNKQKEINEIRNNIQNIIRDELRNNTSLYKNKDADEMSVLFRNLLIERLTKSQTLNLPIKNITTRTTSKVKNYGKYKVRENEYNPPLDEQYNSDSDIDLLGSSTAAELDQQLYNDYLQDINNNEYIDDFKNL